MGTVSPVRAQISSTKKLGIAWVQLCLALAAHVTDEALTGFLSVYNPTVLALQAKLGFWLMPTCRCGPAPPRCPTAAWSS